MALSTECKDRLGIHIYTPMVLTFMSILVGRFEGGGGRGLLRWVWGGKTMRNGDAVREALACLYVSSGFALE